MGHSSKWMHGTPRAKFEQNLQHKGMLCFLQVRVTTNYFPKFSPEELLATVGSCVGLWLGLGVVHIMDIFVTTAGQFFSEQLGWK